MEGKIWHGWEQRLPMSTTYNVRALAQWKIWQEPVHLMFACQRGIQTMCDARCRSLRTRVFLRSEFPCVQCKRTIGDDRNRSAATSNSSGKCKYKRTQKSCSANQDKAGQNGRWIEWGVLSIRSIKINKRMKNQIDEIVEMNMSLFNSTNN